MKWFIAAVASLALGATAAVSAAQGPVLAPRPANPCPSKGNLRPTWVATQVGTDSGGQACGAGGACLETMVVCHNNQASSASSIDVGVEMFDAAGAALGLAVACDVAPGGSAAFVTAALAPPYTGTLIPAGAGPAAPLGSLRVLDTRGRAVCDVTLIDTAGSAVGLTPPGAPLWTKDVNVVRRMGVQRGE